MTAATGFFDHLEVSAEHGFVKGTSEEIDLFRFYAGAAPLNDRTDDTSTIHGRLFNEAPHNGRGWLPLVVRKKPSIWGGCPLAAPPFPGKLNTPRTSAGEGEHFCNISSHLHLNPTRGLNLCPALASADAISWEDAILHPRADEELAKGLDGKDNVVPSEVLGLPSLDLSASRYMQAAYDGIQSELERASSATDSLAMEGILTTKNFRLRRVESYWEFSVPDAVSLVKKLVPSLRAFHRHNREREHGMDCSTVGNALTITLFLGAGEEVRIYAKTANRIRFEVVHSPKKQNGLIPGGYSALTLADCMAKLSVFRQKAAKRVNQALAFLSEWAEETPQARAGASRYASQWFQRLGHSEASVGLLELLRINGRIVAGGCLDRAGRNMARQAKEKGLLFHDEDACALYPVNIGTALPLSGHRLTVEDSSPTALGHVSETQTVSSGFVNGSFSAVPLSLEGVPPSPPSAR